MLPTRRRSPPSYSRLGTAPSTDSQVDDEKGSRTDGSESSGYAWSSTSERPALAHQRSFDFDIEGSSGDAQDTQTGQTAWSVAAVATMLQRTARTVRGKVFLGMAALALVLVL